MKFVWVYIVFINILGFCMMGIDKWKAKHHSWRICEKAFFVMSIMGGSLGTWIGMYTFHHKTKHWYFIVGIPFILAVQIFIVFALK